MTIQVLAGEKQCEGGGGAGCEHVSKVPLLVAVPVWWSWSLVVSACVLLGLFSWVACVCCCVRAAAEHGLLVQMPCGKCSAPCAGMWRGTPGAHPCFHLNCSPGSFYNPGNGLAMQVI